MISLKGLSGWASGYNWYKLGIIVVLLGAWTVAVHMKATHDCEQGYLTQKVEQAEEKTRTVIKEVYVRVPIIQEREANAAVLRQDIRNLKEQLNEAINAKSDNAACDLSDDELRLLQELAGRPAQR